MQLTAKILALFINLMILFQPVIPLLEYEVLNNYIVSELCVEKDVPNSCCQGKCHLEKRLDEAGATNEADKEEGPAVKRIRAFESNLPVNQLTTTCYRAAELKFEDVFSQYWYQKPTEIFHPPCV